MQINSLSDIVNLILIPIKSVLYYHKKKLLFFLLAIAATSVVFFPYSDLTFYAQRKINDLIKPSGSQVTFSELNFSFLPFGMKTENVTLSLPKYSNVEIKELTASPDLLSLLRLQPGGSLNLVGLFGGSLSSKFGLLGKTEEQQNKFSFYADLSRVSLIEIFNFFKLPIKFSGLAQGELSVKGEESFREQPEGEFNFNFNSVSLPIEITTDFGTIQLPKKVNWSNSNLKGNIKDGRIIIENGTLGTKTAPLNGRYKGTLQCPISRRGSSISAACNRYDIKVELELDKDFEQGLARNLSSFITPSQVKKMSIPGGGARYLFTVSGTRYGTPNFRSLSRF